MLGCLPRCGGVEVGRYVMSAAYRFASAMFAAASLSLVVIAATTTPAAASGSVVAFSDNVSPGTIVVRTNQRRLYLVLGQGRALTYPVGVGRAGQQWSGRAVIESKRVRPAWAPPPDIKRENPR